MPDDTDQDRHDLLWKQYELHVELYKFYMELTLKMNLFFYLITGGILTFYFANGDRPFLRFSLLFPVVLAVTLGAISFYGAQLMAYIRAEVFEIRDELSLSTAPDVGVLGVILRAFGSVMFIVAIAMCVLVYLGAPSVDSGGPSNKPLTPTAEESAAG